jgi:hypothetical protein
MDGTATAAGAGGTPPYSYAWSSGDAGEMAINLGPGMVIVTVTDQDNNTATDQVLILEPDPVVVTLTDQMNVTCNGDMDGSATVNASGGTGAITYLWSNGTSTSSNDNLAAGNYTVTATDANNCTGTLMVDITQPDLLVTQLVSSTGVTCNGDFDGSAEVSASGGTGVFTYIWSNGENGPTAFSLGAGFNQVTVTDEANCVDIFEVEILEPDAILISIISTTDVSCAGDDDGSAEVLAGGGSGNFSYAWSNGGIGSLQTNLTAGSYMVTATDGNNCATSINIEIGEPAILLPNLGVISPISCNAAMDGELGLNIQGGTPIYTINWSTGESSNAIGNLGPGNYSVTVTDANNCMAIESIELSEPTELIASAVDLVPVSCAGGTDGMATIDIMGGVAPYIITWPQGGSQQMRMDLAAGTYDVTVSDANNCTDQAMVVIVEPAPLSVTFSSQNVNCFGGNDGNIAAIPGGGAPPYQYAWNTSSTDSTIQNLVAGTYVLTLTDMNACTDTFDVVLSQPDELILSLSGTHESTSGGNDGSISSMVSGGIAPYTYLWSNGDTTENITNLMPGAYSLIIQDVNLCSDTAAFTVNPFGCGLNLDAQITDLTCFESQDGRIILEIIGANGPTTINWSNGSVTDTLEDLEAGIYMVTVNDTANCTVTMSWNVAQPDSLSLAGSSTNETVAGANDGTASVTPSGGTKPYTYQWSNGSTDSVVTNLPPGGYQVTVTDAHNCSAIRAYQINEFGCDINVAINAAVCPNNDTITYCATINGGTMPYSLTWSGGDTTVCITTTVSSISLDVVDKNNCMATANLSPVIPDSVFIIIDSIVISTGNNDGSIFITTMGTDGQTVDYEWTNNESGEVVAQTEDLINVMGGFYNLQLTIGDCVVHIDTLEVPIEVGVSNETADYGIQIYPNPVADVLLIDFSQSLIDWSYIDIVDLNGQSVKFIENGNLNSTVMQISLGDISEGYYVLKIFDGKRYLKKSILRLGY